MAVHSLSFCLLGKVFICPWFCLFVGLFPSCPMRNYIQKLCKCELSMAEAPAPSAPGAVWTGLLSAGPGCRVPPTLTPVLLTQPFPESPEKAQVQPGPDFEDTAGFTPAPPSYWGSEQGTEPFGAFPFFPECSLQSPLPSGHILV